MKFDIRIEVKGRNKVTITTDVEAISTEDLEHCIQFIMALAQGFRDL